MNVEKKQLDKSQAELDVELTYEEFKPYIAEGTTKVSEETQVEGFRPGKAPYDVLKQKVGEMTILERAARLAVNATVDQAITENLERQPVGQPKVDITKLAPGDSMQYKVVVAMLPEITLGDYKGMDVEPEQVEVTEKEVTDTLENLKERQAAEKSVDREVKQGDKVTIDIDMYQDGVAIEGGQSRDTAIIIGQKNLVPGFDEKLLGAKKNEEKQFTLTYPQEHHQKNLAGKNVDFKVVVKEIYEREVPEINDEFAKKMGVNTLEELKKMIKDSLASQKQEEAQQKTEAKLVDKVIENSKFGDIPEVLTNNEAETMVQEMEQTVKSQGGKFDDYLSSIGKTKEQLLLDMTPDAVKRVKSALVIREIANQESIEVTEEEVDKKQNELLEQYKGYQKVEERVKEDSYRHYLRNIIANRKVIDKLKEWNLKGEEAEEEEVGGKREEGREKDEEVENSESEISEDEKTEEKEEEIGGKREEGREKEVEMNKGNDQETEEADNKKESKGTEEEVGGKREEGREKEEENKEIGNSESEVEEKKEEIGGKREEGREKEVGVDKEDNNETEESEEEIMEELAKEGLEVEDDQTAIGEEQEDKEDENKEEKENK
jgi:trigger factor